MGRGRQRREGISVAYNEAVWPAQLVLIAAAAAAIALAFGVYQDLGLILSAALTVALLIRARGRDQADRSVQASARTV